MKFKEILFAVIVVITFTTCDKIEAPYRNQVVAPDFCATGIDDSIPNKKVLVEDYTGHGCGNCPDAGVFLNDTLKGIYNHCIVTISIHAGFFAGTCPGDLICNSLSTYAPNFSTDFTCAVGEAWNTFFGISANPKGMVDRIDYPNNTHVKTVNGWAPAIASQVAKNADAKLTITNSYNSSSRNVSVSVNSEFVNNLFSDYKLQVVLTEDSLIDWQLWYNHSPSEYEPNYLHRHVLRDGLNTTWGEQIATGGVNAGDAFVNNYSYTINNAWNVDHCNIVAFIYDAVTYEVLQVEEAPVR